MPTKRESFGIYSGPLRDSTLSSNSTATSDARDITTDGQPLEMEFVARLDPEPGFPSGPATVVM